MSERDEAQGARSATTESYRVDRRGSEHRATQRFARAANHSTFPLNTVRFLHRFLLRLNPTAVFIVSVILFLYLAWLPVDEESQLILATVIFFALLILRRLPPTPLLRLFFLISAATLTSRYLLWRITSTLAYEGLLSFIAALLLFAAELYGMVVYFLGIFVNVMPLRRAAPSLPEDPALLPSVDVYIPSYNEDPKLLEITLIAALNMRYPKEKLRVCLLDDGGTEQKRNDPDPVKAEAAWQRYHKLRGICAHWGATYLTRAKNLHAKAGNINSALAHTHGDLILILDADHVPTVDLLERTVGFFLADPKLFLVQTPHFFINPDPVERNLHTFAEMPSENEMFYGVIQHGLDFWESSFFCGSAALLRRKMLEEVGGISGGSITEDAETALDLHARGYRSAYYNRPMVAGLQPETYSGFVVQRVRWAQGMVQILLLKNPLRLPGLAPWQRLSYFNSAFFWFFAFARIIFVLAPSAFLIFGLHIYHATLWQFFAYALPHVAGAVLVSHYLFGKVRWSFVSEFYELVQSLYALPGIVRVLLSPRSPSFMVTPKGEQLEKDFISQLAKPFYVLYLFSLITIAFGVWRFLAHSWERGTTVITLGWELFNFVLLTGALGAVFERRQRRGAPRMPADLPAQLILGEQRLSCRVVDLSVTGAKLKFDEPLQVLPSQLHIQVLNRALGISSVLPVVLRSLRGCSAGVEFAPDSDAARREIVALAHGDSARWVEFRRRREDGQHGVAGAFWFLLKHGARGALHHFREIVTLAGTFLLEMGDALFHHGKHALYDLLRRCKNWLWGGSWLEPIEYQTKRK